MEYTTELITAGTAVKYAIQAVNLQLMQRHILLDSWTWDGFYDFATIEKIFIAPKEILIEKNKPYIYVAFDYIPDRTGMEIVRIPERYTTSHFSEKISLN